MNIKLDLQKEIIPIGQRVYLSCPSEDVNGMVATEGGILVPDGENRKQNPIIEMTVEAVGPAAKQVQKGDVVLFNVHNAPAKQAGPVEYRWTEEAHIIAIVRPKNADSPTP